MDNQIFQQQSKLNRAMHYSLSQASRPLLRIFRSTAATAAALLLGGLGATNAQADSDVRPILELMAERGMGAALGVCKVLCSCRIAAPRATGRRNDDGTIAIDGELEATATSLNAKAEVVASYHRQNCQLSIVSSNVTGQVSGGNFVCRMLAQQAGGIDLFRNELKAGRVIDLKPDDCQLVETQLQSIFGP